MFEYVLKYLVNVRTFSKYSLNVRTYFEIPFLHVMSNMLRNIQLMREYVLKYLINAQTCFEISN